MWAYTMVPFSHRMEIGKKTQCTSIKGHKYEPQTMAEKVRLLSESSTDSQLRHIQHCHHRQEAMAAGLLLPGKSGDNQVKLLIGALATSCRNKT